MPDRPRVLVVDDDPVARVLMARLLEGAGLGVTRCPGGEEALAELAYAEYALLVTDLHMPGLSGIELIEESRARHGARPALLVSAEPDPETLERLSRLGACRFLFKPFDAARFLEAVGEVLPGQVRSP